MSAPDGHHDGSSCWCRPEVSPSGLVVRHNLDAVRDQPRTIDSVEPEELARIWTDAECYQSGEVPASYGWWVTNRFDRADLIEAAELVLRTLKGEEPIITRQVERSRDEWNKGLPCDGCAESYPCEIHKGEPGSDSWTMRTRRETK